MYPGSSSDLARLARSTYLHVIRQGLDDLIMACAEGTKLLAAEFVEPAMYQKRRDLVLDFPRYEVPWRDALAKRLETARQTLAAGSQATVTRPASLDTQLEPFSLVEDNVIELDMAVSRLAQAIADKAGWQYTDLSTRLAALQAAPAGKADGKSPHQSQAHDVVKPAVFARWAIDAWTESALSLDQWKTLQSVTHEELALLAEQAYHEANRLLLSRGVNPEIDLRPFVKRARGAVTAKAVALSNKNAEGAMSLASAVLGALQPSAGVSNRLPPGPLDAHPQGDDETRLMTRALDMTVSLVQKQNAVLNKLTQWVGKFVPDFAVTQSDGGQGMQASKGTAAGNQAFSQAMHAAEHAAKAYAQTRVGEMPTPQALVQDLQQRKTALKKAAETPAQRATIEIVALMFQSLLTQERLPAQIRLWFARLQMPVLRVAVSEPDFFATIDHPARLLIDRMGGCVMGFEGQSEAFEKDALHQEIRRIVQVIEAYPETGRMVFQTVLKEFEHFLEAYFRDSNANTRKGVSLAQQLEQREAFAIQYTIELRKMLQDVPVHDAIRDFLFKVWADVMGQSAVQTSPSSDATRGMQRMARDLLWSASAKISRDERREVLVRLPPLLKSLRAGMSSIGLSPQKQEEHIKTLNAALSAAFSAKTITMTDDHLKAIADKLQALDAVLPEMEGVELDADMFRDLSGYESGDLEVVGEGGTMPTPAMMAWANELQLGAWFSLDYRGRQERVQFAWQGLQRHLMLFSTVHGRGILFQVHRLAAFLQAGLLVPEQEESLTVQATRSALAKLNADPARLLD